MSWAHKLVRLLPRKWAAALEAESRQWLLVCPSCGHERSYWDIGGIRYKAAGRPRNLLKCPECGRRTWHHTIRADEDRPPLDGPN